MILFWVLLVARATSLPFEDYDISTHLQNSIEGEDVIDLSELGPEAFGSPTNESGDAVSTWTESSLMNPEEMSNYAEGDILIPTSSQHSRNGMRDQASRWPNGHIPYEIDRRYSKCTFYPAAAQDQRDMIMKAIADFHRLTCLRFVPYNGQANYISITKDNTGCWSSVGRIGGRQEVNLQAPGCVSKKGTIIHELLHAIGFFHEQSRPERDDHVIINYHNIKSGSENNFRKTDSSQVNHFGIPYDYNSVMHYSEYAFSKNSRKTIEPKVGGAKLGQREGLSRGDVRKVNNMYNCNKEEPQTGWFNSVWQNLFGSKSFNPENQ